MESLPDDLKNVLGPSEQVQLYIRQKIYHPKINIDSVVISNERIILRHPHALGLKKDYTDFSYRDVSNVILDRGMLRSTVKCTPRFGGEPLALSGLSNSDAERAYGLIRENLVRYQPPFAAPQAGVPRTARRRLQQLQRRVTAGSVVSAWSPDRSTAGTAAPLV